jgi:uncharacterized protein (TIGR03000 family)
VPEPIDPKKLIYPLRNISSPGFVYGWVGPFPASPRFKNLTVNTWAQPGVDLSTGRPGGSTELNKPPSGGENKTPVGNVDPKKSSGYLTLEVKVPNPDAEVYVGGFKTTQTGTERTFSSPELEPGREFRYEVTVRWTERGYTYEKTKMVVGASGEVIPLDFTNSQVVRTGK